MTVKVSDYIFAYLKRIGVKDVFMLPGGGAMHLVDSLGHSGIRYTCFLHEQAAAIASESYAQNSNKLSVTLVTSGPGGTNTLTAVAAGWIDSTPMLLISGQAKRSDLVGDRGVRQIGSQEVQITEMAKPVTKYAVQILDPNLIAYHLERAIYEATSGRPGPVWLDIPLDVQGSFVEETTLEHFYPQDKDDKEESRCDLKDVCSKVISFLREAKKPLLLAGNGIKLSNAECSYRDLARCIGAPVQTTWKTIDMFSEEDSLYAGHPGTMGDRGANFILQEADLLISIGSRLDTSLTAFNEEDFARNALKVVVDIDQHELDRMQIPNCLKICADANDFISVLGQLLNNENLPSYSDWLARCKKIRKDYPVILPQYGANTERVSCYHFIDVLSDLLTDKDVIVPESSGGAAEITCQAFRPKYGQKMKHAAGLGSMGFGLPYAIGACIACNERRTVLINGDGAFQLNIQELKTLERLNLPIKIFVWLNDGYASIRNMQRNNFEGFYVASGPTSGLEMPDIEKVSNAYGIKTYHIKRNSDVEDKLRTILIEPGPSLCVVDVDPNEVVSPKSVAKRMPDGSMISMPLDNMWPYLDE